MNKELNQAGEGQFLLIMGCGNPHGCPHTKIEDQQSYVLVYDAIIFSSTQKTYQEIQNIPVAVCSGECSEAAKDALAHDCEGNLAVNIRVMTAADWLLSQ